MTVVYIAFVVTYCETVNKILFLWNGKNVVERKWNVVEKKSVVKYISYSSLLSVFAWNEFNS